MQFTAGRYIQPHALLVGQLGHGRTQKGLGGVSHSVTPGAHRLPAAGPQVGLVVDEERSTYFVGQGDKIDTPHA